jgi:hypothetical protein
LRRIAAILFLFVIEKQISAQDTLKKIPPPKNNFFIHYYPSVLVVGDISLGAEHLNKSRFGQELSFNLKAFQSNFYNYNKGYRIDYLIKYVVINRKRFRFSADLSFEYVNIYFNNKQIDHYYGSLNANAPVHLYEILLENRKLKEYGAGIGFSINFKIYRNFSFGADVVANFVKYRIDYNYKELIYRDPGNSDPPEPSVPSTVSRQNSNLSLSPLLRLKLSYTVGKLKFIYLNK